MMEFGLDPGTVQKICQVLARYPEVESAAIYGSRAKGNYRPDSDIDIALAGAALNLGIQFRIANDLDDLLMPYKIDLTLLHTVTNPALIDHIRRVGKTFYRNEQIG